jgi:hypothetical protein
MAILVAAVGGVWRQRREGNEQVGGGAREVIMIQISAALEGHKFDRTNIGDGPSEGWKMGTIHPLEGISA